MDNTEQTIDLEEHKFNILLEHNDLLKDFYEGKITIGDIKNALEKEYAKQFGIYQNESKKRSTEDGQIKESEKNKKALLSSIEHHTKLIEDLRERKRNIAYQIEILKSKFFGLSLLIKYSLECQDDIKLSHDCISYYRDTILENAFNQLVGSLSADKSMRIRSLEDGEEYEELNLQIDQKKMDSLLELCE